MSELTNSAQEIPVESYDDLSSGTKLLHGQYTIEQFLNAGGFGVTYLAKDSLDRTVVIKECFPSSVCRRSVKLVHARSRAFGRELESIIKLFVGEARTLSRLNHPNIVGVHQVFEENGTAYMALDYVEGVDLITMIEEDEFKVSPKQIQKMLVRLLSAAHTIHGVGILHRDISPDNILVDNEMRPVLIDFGAARESAVRKSRMLSAMRVVKDGYSPYEFYVADSKQGPYSDLYSLGATFYHVVSGEIPPESQARLGAIAGGTEDPCEPLTGRFPEYDPVFLASIDKAMSVLPQDRPQTAREWKEILDGTRKITQDGTEVEATDEDHAAPATDAPVDPTTASITEIVALQRSETADQDPEAAIETVEVAVDPVDAEPPATIGDDDTLVLEADDAADVGSAPTEKVRPTRPAATQVKSRINPVIEDMEEDVVPPAARSGSARMLALAGTGVGVLAVAGVLAFALSSRSSEDTQVTAADETSAGVIAPVAEAEPTVPQAPVEDATPAPLETVVADPAEAPEPEVETAAVEPTPAPEPEDVAADPAPVPEAAPEVAPEVAETPAAPAADGSEPEVAATAPLPQVLSVTPVEDVTNKTVTVPTAPTAEVASNWTLRLPAGMSATPGAARETLFAINGVNIGSSQDMAQALNDTVQIGTERELTVEVLAGTSREAASVRTLTLPIVQQTGAGDGMLFETSYVDGSWTTVVAAMPRQSQSDLQIGDQLIAIISTEELLDTRTALVDALTRESEDGNPVIEVALMRSGNMWAGSIAIEDLEGTGGQ